MKKILFIIIIITIFLLGLSFVSAKEDAHFDIEKISDYSVSIILKDSSNNPISGKIEINITKPNGYTKILHDKKLNNKGKIDYFLGSNKGQYVVSVHFKGNSNYNPCSLTKDFYVSGFSGNSAEYYYDSHNYGESVKMDDFIYDNYYDEEIYDNPYNYDGEGY